MSCPADRRSAALLAAGQRAADRFFLVRSESSVSSGVVSEFNRISELRLSVSGWLSVRRRHRLMSSPTEEVPVSSSPMSKGLLIAENAV